jgi:hypothetical protein
MANLTLLKSESKLFEETLNRLVEDSLEDGAEALQAARRMWRKHRDLVEAPAFPAHLRAPFIARIGVDPDEDDCDFYGELDPAIARKENLSHARDLVREKLERASRRTGHPHRVAG